MHCKAGLSMNSRQHGSTTSKTRTRTITMYSSGRVSRGLQFFVIIAIFNAPIFLSVNAVPCERGHPRTVRLCSKSLSDALYLICRDRGGYNEPYMYSAEDPPRVSTGPGLVEECCYRPCSYEQLEQYCKPESGKKSMDDSHHGIEESVRIVNLPYNSMGESMDERRTVTKSQRTIDRAARKSKGRKVKDGKGRGSRIARKHDNDFYTQRVCKRPRMLRKSEGKHMRGQSREKFGNDKRDDDTDDADVKVTARRACRRLRRRKRPRRGKTPRDGPVVKFPKFKVGTTLPEPKDSSILLFPSRTNIDFRRVSNDLEESRDLEKFEKKRFYRFE